MEGPEAIAAAIVAALGEETGIIPANKIEAVMRPFGAISWNTGQQLRMLLRARGKSDLGMDIGPWIEANYVVLPPGTVVEGDDRDELERRIDFLLRDTCTCVLEHLPKAIAHAPGPIDPRILQLVSREEPDQ